MTNDPTRSSKGAEPDATTEAARGGSAPEPPTVLPPLRFRGEQPGDWVGPFKLLEIIGQGTFGYVWAAERREPFVLRVALKILKAGMDSESVIARFEQERQLIALMDHPNVAKIFEGGVTASGRPYFAMELVKGVPITQFCDQAKLSIDDRLKLFAQVCDAVQHAHLKGAIHRDLKPSNILVTSGDATAPAIPKVIDFGMAKALSATLVDRTIHTEVGQMVGTLEYMSPEQAASSPAEVDTRTDVYSLGVLLYELLTGQLPLNPRAIAEEGIEAVLRFIRTREPPKPSTRIRERNSGETRGIAVGDAAATNADAAFMEIAEQRSTDVLSLERLIRGSLDWITTTAMEKDRKDRYKSAEELAAEVRKYLNGDPIIAGPRGLVTELRRLSRRYRREVFFAVAILSLLVAGSVTIALLYVYAREETAKALAQKSIADTERGRAESNAENAQWLSYVANIAAADAALRIGDADRANTYLSACPVQHRSWDWDYLSSILDSSVRSLSLKLDFPVALAIPPRSRDIAVLSQATLRLFPPGSNAAPRAIPFFPAQVPGKEQRDVLGLAIDPSSTFMVTRHQMVESHPWCELWLSRASDGAHLRMLSQSCWEDAAGRRCAVFDREGRRVAVREPNDPSPRIAVFGTADQFPPVIIAVLGLLPDLAENAAFCFAFEGNDRVILGDDTLSYYDATTGVRLGQHLPTGGAGPVETMTIDDSTRFVATSARGVTDVWDLTVGKRIRTIQGTALALLFLSDGRLAAGIGSDLVIFEPQSSLEPLVLHGHSGRVLCLAQDPASGMVWTGASDSTVRAFDSQSGATWLSKAKARKARLDPTGRQVALIGEIGTKIHILDAEGKDTQPYARSADSVAYSPDGTMIALGEAKTDSPDTKKRLDQLAVVNTSTGKEILVKLPTLDPAAASPPEGQSSLQLAFVGGSSRLVVVGDLSGELGVWLFDTVTGEQIASQKIREDAAESPAVRALAVTARGDKIAVSDGARVHIFDGSLGLEVETFSFDRFVSSLVFDPPGRCLAGTLYGFNPLSGTFEVAIHELQKGNTHLVPSGAMMNDVIWSVDGSRIIYGGEDKVLRVWDVAHGVVLLAIPLDGKVLSLDRSPDGASLAAWLDTDHLWFAATRRRP